MKTKTQHTPTPWHYDGEFIRTGLKRFGATDPIEIVAEISDRPNWEANASFIVRAVNSHEALIEAVKDLRYAFYVENSSKKLKEAFTKHAEILKEIISQAEGGK